MMRVTNKHIAERDWEKDSDEWHYFEEKDQYLYMERVMGITYWARGVWQRHDNRDIILVDIDEWDESIEEMLRSFKGEKIVKLWIWEDEGRRWCPKQFSGEVTWAKPTLNRDDRAYMRRMLRRGKVKFDCHFKGHMVSKGLQRAVGRLVLAMQENKAERQINAMPAWMQRQFELVDKTVASWPESKQLWVEDK